MTVAAIIKTMTASSRARLVNPAIIAVSPVVLTRVNRGESSLNYRCNVISGLKLSSAKNNLFIASLIGSESVHHCASDSSHWQNPSSTCALAIGSSRDRNQLLNRISLYVTDFGESLNDRRLGHLPLSPYCREVARVDLVQGSSSHHHQIHLPH